MRPLAPQAELGQAASSRRSGGRVCLVTHPYYHHSVRFFNLTPRYPVVLPQPHQRGRKVAVLLATYEAWIAIQHDGLGSALPAQGLDHCLVCCFGGEILAHVGVDQQRSAHVDGIEDLDHMVL